MTGRSPGSPNHPTPSHVGVTPAYAPDARLPYMTVVAVRRGKRLTVTAVGDVDHDSAPLLSACLISNMDTPGLREVRLDLTGVSYVNAGGLAAIAVAHRTAAAQGVTCTIVCRPRQRQMRQLLRWAALTFDPADE